MAKEKKRGDKFTVIPNSRKPVGKCLSAEGSFSVERSLQGSSSQPTNTTDSTSQQESRVIYVGRIPHGFYEHQMRSYLSQFGLITNLRISRNKETGNSKHYGFVEFQDSQVAKIVASTMNNYLLSGSLIQCHVIPPNRIHPALFKGANRHFKVIPWQQIRQARHNKAVDQRLALLGKKLEIEQSEDPNDPILAPFQGWNFEGEPETPEEELLRQALEIIEPSPLASSTTPPTAKQDEELTIAAQKLEHRRKRISENMQKRSSFMQSILSSK